MEPFEKQLSAELAALRPTPHPTFAAELDERAAAGFPRRAESGTSALHRLVDRLRAVQPRRVLLPAGATALAAVAAVTVVVGLSEPENESSGPVAVEQGDTRQVSPDGFFKALQPPAAGSAATEFAVPPPTVKPAAAQVPQREIERSAEIVLGADPAEVGAGAAKVFDVVHAHRGIVLESSTSEGDAGVAEARFELLIPSAKLGDAMADFSQIAEVRSRHEATADITAPTIGVGERLRDSRARIDGLLAQLASADTAGEREAVEAELRGERRHAAALRSRLSSLQRRANLSRVSLRIESGASTSPTDSDQSWGVGDALGDAGHILGIAAGVAVIGLAILAPIALIALLAWLASRAWIRRGRSRALD